MLNFDLFTPKLHHDKRYLIVLKDKVTLDLIKDVGQDIARFKALIVYHFNDITRVITELIKFGIQIADVFIQILGNVVNFGKETYNPFVNLDEGKNCGSKDCLVSLLHEKPLTW